MHIGLIVLHVHGQFHFILMFILILFRSYHIMLEVLISCQY